MLQSFGRELLVPPLLPVETSWNVNPEFFAWPEGGLAAPLPAAYARAASEIVIFERTIFLPINITGQLALEIIHFAAANRLIVKLTYR